jgi:G:T/U-mismatch repair DNA glycosylase
MISKLLKQIREKRQRAKRAGLEIISADELAMLALKSPHWREIGQGQGKYHFCRRDHSIGYTAENTFVGPSLENIRERLKRCGHPSTLTPKQRKQIASRKREAKRVAKARANEQRRALEREIAKYYRPAAVLKTLPKAVIKERLLRRKRKAAAAGKAATACNSATIILGE